MAGIPLTWTITYDFGSRFIASVVKPVIRSFSRSKSALLCPGKIKTLPFSTTSPCGLFFCNSFVSRPPASARAFLARRATTMAGSFQQTSQTDLLNAETRSVPKSLALGKRYFSFPQAQLVSVHEEVFVTKVQGSIAHALGSSQHKAEFPIVSKPRIPKLFSRKLRFCASLHLQPSYLEALHLMRCGFASIFWIPSEPCCECNRKPF